MLSLTKFFGPLITMIKAMANDFAKFAFLWFNEMIAISFMGFIVFSELPSYPDLAAAFIIQFEAALGNWTMKSYDGFSLGDQYGEIW
jgi:hypothetical protein